MERGGESSKGRKEPKPKLPGPLAAKLSAQLSSGEAMDDAIDDTVDADDDLVKTQRRTEQLRLKENKPVKRLLRKIIPFHWSPVLIPLTESDVETCVILEKAALPDAAQRATKEKIEYRIRTCGNLCFGFFNSCRLAEAKDWWIQTMRHCRDVETGRADGAKHVMFAHIIATLGEGPVITDGDMAYPQNWRDTPASRSSTLGHRTQGRTICLHSFSVCPEVQGISISKTVMKCYVDMMRESQVADRIALLCKEPMVNYFKHLGYKHLGPSNTTAAGTGWQNMVLELPKKTVPKHKQISQEQLRLRDRFGH